MRTLVLMATYLVVVEETSPNKKEWAIGKKLWVKVQQQAVFITIFAICSSVFICMQRIIIYIYAAYFP